METTNLLSRKTSAGLSIGIPKDLNLYLKDSRILIAIRSATNYNPELE